MEIITYIENHTQATLPTFKHPTKTIKQNNIQTQQPQQQNLDSVYSENISIPDRIIMDPSVGFQNQLDNNIKCYLLFGYQLKLKDWELMKQMYNINVKIKLYRGNQIVQISQGVMNAKSFIKGQKNINQPLRTLIKRDQKTLQSFAFMYTVQISSTNSDKYKKIIYYLPSLFDKKSKEYPLQCIKCRYFNHKMLQILSQYVSLQNGSTSCCKDIAHHEFEAVLYSGNVVSFQIFLKLVDDVCSEQVSESFIQKLTQISMTDQHLMDQVDPFDFSQIKKQIRYHFLQQKRLRTSLTFQKIKIVQQIQNALQFLNLKQLYPKKLTYNSITAQMLKKIRNQNLQNKAVWIKEQNFIIKNLQARIIDLQKTKQKYKNILMQQEKNNYEEIQQIRNQIKLLQKSIKYQQVEKVNKKFDDSIRKNKSTIATKVSNNNNTITSNMKNTTNKSELSVSKNIQNERVSILSNKNSNFSSSEATKYKQQLESMQKQKILKFQMIKAQFQMEKQFVRRKNQYTKATQDLLNYLIDC